MLNIVAKIVNLNRFERKRTPWNVSIIIINGMPVAICDQYLNSVGDHYESETTIKKTVKKIITI